MYWKYSSRTLKVSATSTDSALKSFQQMANAHLASNCTASHFQRAQKPQVSFDNRLFRPLRHFWLYLDLSNSLGSWDSDTTYLHIFQTFSISPATVDYLSSSVFHFDACQNWLYFYLWDFPWFLIKIDFSIFWLLLPLPSCFNQFHSILLLTFTLVTFILILANFCLSLILVFTWKFVLLDLSLL